MSALNVSELLCVQLGENISYLYAKTLDLKTCFEKNVFKSLALLAKGELVYFVWIKNLLQLKSPLLIVRSNSSLLEENVCKS